MKAKLLSTALVAFAAFGLAACGGTPELPGLSISAVIDWDDSSNSPTRDGEVVRLNDVIVGAVYSDNCFTVQKVEGNQVIAIEVITTESIAEVFTVKDIVDVEGTITSTDGRPQLIDATIEWGTGGKEKCDNKGSINYYRDFTRPAWDYNIKRSWSGRWVENTWQLATVPTITAGEETIFQVVFPGENLDVNDFENYCIIDVVIPALSEEHAEHVNEWASQFEVGDGVYLFSQVYFSNYICMILPITSFQFTGTNLEKEITGVYSTFGEAELGINEKINVDLPSFASTSVYSWVIDTESYTSELETGEEVPVVIVSANTKDVETALYDIIDADSETGYAGVKYEEEGWYLVQAGAVDSDGTIGYLFVNGQLQESEETDPESGETIYEVVDTTCSILVYPSGTAVVLEIEPTTTDVVITPAA